MAEIILKPQFKSFMKNEQLMRLAEVAKHTQFSPAISAISRGKVIFEEADITCLQEGQEIQQGAGWPDNSFHCFLGNLKCCLDFIVTVAASDSGLSAALSPRSLSFSPSAVSPDVTPTMTAFGISFLIRFYKPSFLVQPNSCGF